jgi:hypothetical protein
MTDYEESHDEQQAPPRRGWRRFFLRGLVVLLILCSVALIARWRVSRIGQRQLNEVITQLDAIDRGWRLEDIEAARARAAPSDDKNSSNIIIALHKAIPPEWKDIESGRGWEWGPVTNYQPSFVEIVWLVQGERITADVRQSLRQQLLRPDIVASAGGHYVLIHNENPIMTLLPNTQNARGVAALLDYDARVLVLAKKGDQAIASARAGLVVAKSIGDEPFLISQLVRVACDRVAAHAALQVLALAEPTEGLGELQNELRAEADVPWLQYGFRGERGLFNQLFEVLESGKVNFADLEGLARDNRAIMNSMALEAYKPLLPGDRAKSLEILTAYLEAAKLPAHEQKAAMAQIKLPPRPPDDIRYVVTNLMMPAVVKVAEASWRTRADLLTASTAIACERFRLGKGRWPKSLAEVPTEILPDIPLDPFNGKPIQYRKLEDGVAVFTIGDEQDARRWASGETSNDPMDKIGRGWRLWDPESRKVPHPHRPGDPMQP